MRLIDADALKEAMYPLVTYRSIEAYIDNAPTIEKRKTGEWILEPYNAENDLWIHNCGECLQPIMVGGKNKKFKFCPNCGARMKE